MNSGSFANLCAFMALTLPQLKECQIRKGDEIITVPVFVDITTPEYNIDITKLEEARTEKTKAVFLTHTLGNPVNL